MAKFQSRKQLRKQMRKEKKVKKKEYFCKSKKQKNLPNAIKEQEPKVVPKKGKQSATQKSAQSITNNIQESDYKKEKNELERLKKEMQKQRLEQLTKANLVEDKAIKRLEKQLKLNKRKSKTLPKSFSSDGLDYLLEICDPENISKVVSAEQQLAEVNDEFNEDLDLITGTGHKKKTSQQSNNWDLMNEDEDLDEEEESDFDEDSESEEPFNRKQQSKISHHKKNYDSDSMSEDEDLDEEEEDFDEQFEEEETSKRKQKQIVTERNKKQKVDVNSDDEKLSSEESEDDSKSTKPDGSWTDIYGRLRGKDGSVIEESSKKYIPPAVRARMAAGQSGDKIAAEKLRRLQRELKGLINRLAESNMHSISTQIENLYMNNSRNDMNESLTNLLLNSLMSTVLTPERLLLEHVMLIAILHANVGTEIGAHFLQVVVKKFNDLTLSEQEIEDKTLDNVVMVLAQLYNFKIFHCKLVHQIIERLTNKFEEEKFIECILHILKSVGFTLRKDDPLALKDLIINMRKKAATIQEETKKENPRLKFMLDILTAIKNNNVTKIPNYDTTYSEHLKKLIKSFIRKGNYITTLNISLEDLLKADERGKWWVVGSAWMGKNETENKQDEDITHHASHSQELLALAKKERMNTDTRRKIFCTILSSEDYLDAFVKLLHLGLRGQEEREIMNVILHCCLQQKEFNPFYAVLAQKFCDYDRKFQMNIKCSIWDKLKTLTKCSTMQLANLSKLLIHLFIQKGLPITTLKIVEFSELDKITLRFTRQILLGILLHENTEECLGVFEKVAVSEKLKMFKESLRLFIQHFVLKNLKESALNEDKKKLLENRAELIEKLLNARQRSRF